MREPGRRLGEDREARQESARKRVEAKGGSARCRYGDTDCGWERSLKLRNGTQNWYRAQSNKRNLVVRSKFYTKSLVRREQMEFSGHEARQMKAGWKSARSSSSAHFARTCVANQSSRHARSSKSTTGEKFTVLLPQFAADNVELAVRGVHVREARGRGARFDFTPRSGDAKLRCCVFDTPALGSSKTISNNLNIR